MTIRIDSRRAAIAFNMLAAGGDSRAFRAVLDAGVDPADIFRGRTAGAAFLGHALAGRIKAADPAGLADAELARAGQIGVEVVTWYDNVYPSLLRNIPDPPPVLYVLGALPGDDLPLVGVVGSRAATPYGLGVAGDIGAEACRVGFGVVSGLARGIDTEAHRGALDAGGVTLAVLACGLDSVYPPDNTALARAIARRGAVVSEFPIGAGPERYRFPRRNRIISGLCRALVVVEAGEASGALITASFALDQGREVFAVPGPIGSDRSSGCHRLIADGARIFRDLGDLAAMIAPTLDRPVPPPCRSEAPAAPLSDEERRVIALFHGLPLSMDDIIRRASLPPAAAAATVLGLELKGALRNYPGNRYLSARGGH